MEEHVALARYTTIGTGGPARWFARPRRSTSSSERSPGPRERAWRSRRSGSARTCSSHDDGVDALVLKLAGELAAARVEGETLVAGGGAANAVCLHRARAAGLGGFEFASAIPGTVGGGVRMNAGAYGREWRDVLVDAVVVDADGARTLDAAELELSYRHSGLGPGEVVAEVRFRLEPRPPAEVKAPRRRAARAAEGDAADEQADVRQRLQEPGRRARGGAADRGVRLKGHRIGGAHDLAAARELHRERRRRTSADCVALMAEARRRVHERFGVVLEHEVQFLGPLELPPL